MNHKKWLIWLMLAVSALLTGLTLVFPVLWWLEWISMAPMGVVLLTLASDPRVRLRRLYGLGVFYFFCFGLVIFHWFLHMYPLSFIEGMTGPAALSVVLAGWLGLSFLQAVMGGLVFLVAGLLFRCSASVRFPILRPFFAASLWAVYEWSQTLGWWGVPWGRLPLGQTGFLPGIQTASLLGSYLITFLLVAVNFCAALAWMNRSHGMLRRAAVLCAAGILAFQFGAGTVTQWLWSRADYDTVRVAAVQGNIDSGEKWTAESTLRTYAVYEEYTVKAAEAGAQIVIWPESALPYSLEPGNDAYGFVSELAARVGVTVLVGGFTDSPNGDGDYNSIVCFLPDGSRHRTVYSKRHLVPFGEYVPMERAISILLPALGELEMSGASLLEGEEPCVFELEEGVFGSLICFDSIYEELTRDSVRAGAQMLCISTNDSWFTDSAALHMHNAQAKLRAVESRRFAVRSANTGLTTLISPTGQVTDELAIQTDGVLVCDAGLLDGQTLYMRVGNLFVCLCLAFLAYFLGHDPLRRMLRRWGGRKDT